MGGVNRHSPRRALTDVVFVRCRFPWMRRQTLAGKAFLTFWGTAFGMVTYAVSRRELSRTLSHYKTDDTYHRPSETDAHSPSRHDMCRTSTC